MRDITIPYILQMNGRTKKGIYRETLQLKIRENVEENMNPNHV